MSARPAVVESGHVLGVHALRRSRIADREGEHRTGRPGLFEDAVAAAQTQRIRIPESANTPQCAVVVIERSVLLHDEDYMLDRIEPAGADGCRQCTLKRRREKGSSGDCSCTDPGGEKRPSGERIPRHLCSIDKSIGSVTAAVTCCCRCSESVQRQQCRANCDQDPKRPLSEPRLPEPPFPPSSGAAETLTTDSSDADCVNPLRPAYDALIR